VGREFVRHRGSLATWRASKHDREILGLAVPAFGALAVWGAMATWFVSCAVSVLARYRGSRWQVTGASGDRKRPRDPTPAAIPNLPRS
jgi:hypothetical protein